MIARNRILHMPSLCDISSWIWPSRTIFIANKNHNLSILNWFLNVDQTARIRHTLQWWKYIIIEESDVICYFLSQLYMTRVQSFEFILITNCETRSRNELPRMWAFKNADYSADVHTIPCKSCNYNESEQLNFLSLEHIFFSDFLNAINWGVLLAYCDNGRDIFGNIWKKNTKQLSNWHTHWQKHGKQIIEKKQTCSLYRNIGMNKITKIDYIHKERIRTS